MDGWLGVFFWGFLLAYGALMWVLSPHAVSAGGGFRGEDAAGRSATPGLLTASIFISWIFAKSVTNAANLGARYGLVGGLLLGCLGYLLPGLPARRAPSP